MSTSRPKLALTPPTQALLILAICASAIHFGGTKLKQLALAHPSLQVIQRDPPVQAAPAQTGAINVILEDSIRPPTSATLEKLSAEIPNQLFGTTFKGQSAGSTAQSEAIDYFSQLSSHIRLDAIAKNGAVINGVFINVGDPVDAFAYPAPGESSTKPEKLIAPKLGSITDTAAILRESVQPYRTLKLHFDQ